MRDSKDSIKFMQVLDRTIFLRLSRVAKARGITVQELIRVIVIPFWMNRLQVPSPSMRSDNRQQRQRRLARSRKALRHEYPMAKISSSRRSH